MNLPQSFIDTTEDILTNEFPAFIKALRQPAPTSIRLNNKADIQDSENTKVPWCKDAFYLTERPLFTADPLFHAGAYYVQEASSMFLGQVVEQFFPNAQTVLDLCAAPGGKSTLLTQTLADNCLLVSNEIVRSRAYILAENLAKWGAENVIVSNNDAATLGQLRHCFDAIVVDAPCSGEGMFRKDPEAINEWSEKNVEICTLRQKDIVTDVWDALKPGGILVYSTCTFNRRENEDNIAWIVDNFDAEVLMPDTHDFPEIVQSELGCRFYFHKVRGEGFFISVLRKSDKEPVRTISKLQIKKGLKFMKPTDLPFSLTQPDDWFYINDNNFIRAYSKLHFDISMHLNVVLNCINSGLLMFEVKGKDFIPSAQLALSKVFDKNSCFSAELNRETALHFLKRDNIVLTDLPKTYILVCYQNVALGWVKNLGNRTNNLYPQNWKIRMNLQ